MDDNPLSPDEESTVDHMIENGAGGDAQSAFSSRGLGEQSLSGNSGQPARDILQTRASRGTDQDAREGRRAPEGSFLGTVGVSRSGRSRISVRAETESAPVVDLAIGGQDSRAVLGVYEYRAGTPSDERRRAFEREDELKYFKSALDRGTDPEKAMRDNFVGFTDKTRSTVAFVEDDTLYVANRWNGGGIVIDRGGEVIPVPVENRSVSRMQLQPGDRILMGTPIFGRKIGGTEHAADEIRGEATQTASDKLLQAAGAWPDMSVIVADCKGE